MPWLERTDGESSKRIAASRAAGLRCMYRCVVRGSERPASFGKSRYPVSVWFPFMLFIWPVLLVFGMSSAALNDFAAWLIR